MSLRHLSKSRARPGVLWPDDGRTLDQREKLGKAVVTKLLADANYSATVAEVGKSVNSGFSSFGEYLQVLAKAAEPNYQSDRRLVRAPTGAGEIDPSAGGFLVPHQFVETLMGILYDQAVLLPYVDVRETTAPLGAGVKIPAIDEVSRQDGLRMGGLLAYWLPEGQTITLSQFKARNIELDPKKLLCAISVTNELLADASLLETVVTKALGLELAFKLDQAILAGSGAGMPLGILSSGALITVAKEIGQQTKTVLAENVRKMWSRLAAPSRKRAFWIVNEDLEDALESMVEIVGTGATVAPSANALYMPRGADGNEYPLLKGRPVLVAEQSSVLGSVGDIVLADLSQYVLVRSPLSQILSAHVSFTSDQSIFRFSLRADGASVFTSPVAPFNGSNITRSPFVALAAR
jgi:HK97 family phage major capsid protein